MWNNFDRPGVNGKEVMKYNYAIVAAFALSVMCGQNTSPLQNGLVQANGIRIHYLDWGGGGEPLVLLTGYGATADVFDGLAHRFNERFHVLAFTRRGRAPSERTPSGYDLKTLTSDLHAFLDTQRLDRVHLAGHSFAGAEMTEFASRYPNRVISLVYLDAAFDAAAGEAVMRESPFPPPTPPPGSPYAQVLEWWASYTPDFSRLKSPALAFYALQDHNPHIPRDASESARRQGEEFWKTKWTPMVRRAAQKFSRETPNSQVIILENTSHYLFRDREEEVVREMTKFYNSLH